MVPLLGHILGFPLEEMLISLGGVGVAALTAAVAMRLRAAREALRRRARVGVGPAQPPDPDSGSPRRVSS